MNTSNEARTYVEATNNGPLPIKKNKNNCVILKKRLGRLMEMKEERSRCEL